MVIIEKQSRHARARVSLNRQVMDGSQIEVLRLDAKEITTAFTSLEGS